MFSASEQRILRQIESGLRTGDRRFCARFTRQQRAFGWARLVVVAWLLVICAITHVSTVLAEVAQGARLTAKDVGAVVRRFGRRHTADRRADRAATV
jgi:hypothetical protein